MLVVDASVAVKIATAEVDSDRAIEAVAYREDCIAPDLLLTEVASALAKKVRFAGLPPGMAESGLETVYPLFAEFAETRDMLRAAIGLSAALNHSLFDCVYLALAIERECELVTADLKFAAIARAGGYATLIRTLR